MLNHLRRTLLMLLSIVLSTAFASAQPKEVVREQISLKGTVEGIDPTARTVTIRGEKGNVITLDVSRATAAFDQLKLGDVVKVEYLDRVSVRLKPAGEPDVDRTEPPVTTTTPGALPGASVVSQRVTTVTVTGWDLATRTVTFTGPAGTEYSRRLLDTTDASVLAGLKAGDRVDVTRTEAARLAVESRTTVDVAVTEGFRNRFTISALWGWENNFNGHMIRGVNGLTNTGTPLNVTETSFDDVYGRMTNFKAGIGWRTSPRSELVFNFVVSQNTAERVNLGTAGSNNEPVFVDFDDYNNYGIEGGQRWFFTRARFTPFLGYLVGVNRYDDIKGTVVDAPLMVNPLIVSESDGGKYFEQAWAFNFGPTGGLLIGMGPIEMVLETQIRYMGGLSDVEWLAEDGLREINSGSSRWSFPIQLGARIRF